jgi:hypothetical protein
MPGNIARLDDLAKTIARELLADCKAGNIAKIGIGEIRAAIAARTASQALRKWEIEHMETLTLRRCIEGTF